MRTSEAETTTRFSGVIAKWRGDYGFIKADSGDSVFFGGSRVRQGIPMEGLPVTYALDVDRQGRRIAVNVIVED